LECSGATAIYREPADLPMHLNSWLELPIKAEALATAS
jgi:hypothetical protein